MMNLDPWKKMIHRQAKICQNLAFGGPDFPASENYVKIQLLVVVLFLFAQVIRDYKKTTVKPSQQQSDGQLAAFRRQDETPSEYGLAISRKLQTCVLARVVALKMALPLNCVRASGINVIYKGRRPQEIQT